jgi:hypothetical protein
MFEAIMYHFIALTGHNTAWNVMFYIFSLLKGLLMVAIILLVGAGWSIMKPFLNEREKKLFMIALPLQLLANAAIIVTDEIAPGSRSYTAWSNVLHVADIFAAGVVLFPIIYSIRHLQQAQAAESRDGAWLAGLPVPTGWVGTTMMVQVRTPSPTTSAPRRHRLARRTHISRRLQAKRRTR